MSALETASAEATTNTMPFILDAVNAGATAGEICTMWRKVYGEYKEQVVV